jgi:hypothetical protein
VLPSSALFAADSLPYQIYQKVDFFKDKKIGFKKLKNYFTKLKTLLAFPSFMDIFQIIFRLKMEKGNLSTYC